MNSFVVTLTGLFLVYAVIISTGKILEIFDPLMWAVLFLVYCTDLKDGSLTKDEIIALTRDHFGRSDPDQLLNGFFPVWAVIQFIIACKSLMSRLRDFLSDHRYI